MAANRRPARSLKDVDLLTEDRRRRHADKSGVVFVRRFTQVSVSGTEFGMLDFRTSECVFF